MDQLRYYFEVNNRYVLEKLALVSFAPALHFGTGDSKFVFRPGALLSQTATWDTSLCLLAGELLPLTGVSDSHICQRRQASGAQVRLARARSVHPNHGFRHICPVQRLRARDLRAVSALAECPYSPAQK